MNFGKFLRTYFLQTTFGELLLRFLRNLFSFLTRSPLRGCFCILKKNCYAEIVAPVAAKYSNGKNDEFQRFIKQIAIPSSKRILQSFTDVIQNKCSFKFCKFHRETPVLQSLFNKVAGLRLVTLLKRDSKTGVSL